jgi:hypothetical protein
MSSSALTISNSRACAAVAFVSAAVLALAIGRDLLHMPLQVSDSLSLITDAALAPSAWDAFYQHLSGGGYFRPLFYAEVKALFDLGHHFLTYRLFHALLVFAFFMLFVRALEVRDRLSLLCFPLALTVFVGMHTFLATVKEQYPVPHFLQVAVLALVALNLTQSKGGVLVDAALLLTFSLAALTLESGLLVWVVVAAAWASGMPGVSRRAVIGITVLLATYMWVRFGFYGTGLPTIDDRAVGLWLERLDPPEIRERFGDNFAPLYLYNMAASALSLLFSEPRSGIWVTVRDSIAAVHVVNITASLFATGLVGSYVVSRFRSGVRRPVTLADRHVVIFAAVLVGNVAISYAYAKDEIISVAGAFYPYPVFGAAVYFLSRWQERGAPWLTTLALCAVFLAGSTVWATRAAGVHHVLRSQAFVQRNDWTRVEAEWRRNGNWEQYRAVLPLVRNLREEAISMRVVNPRFVPRWMEDVFDRYY